MSTALDTNSLVQLLPEGEKIELGALCDFVASRETGAVVTFEGIVRQTENDTLIDALYYEYHSDMAQKELQRVVNSALSQFDVQRIACVHRVGRVPSGEASVSIAVGSAHRAAAFDACEYIIDTLKVSVPIWKSVASRER